jgi:hypothetical protein
MNKLIITFLTIFIISCGNLVDRPKIDQDSKDILNLAFDNSVGADSIWRYNFKIPPVNPSLLYGKKISSLENKKFLRWQDSLKCILDTLELFMVIHHKIDTLTTADIFDIIETITSNKKNITDNLNGDTSFNEALKELCNNKLVFDTLETEKFITRFNYKIYSDRLFPDDKFKQVGTVSFSKVGFSSKKDKAVIYTSFMCGRLCGNGRIFFYEKIMGKWRYIRTWERWVS